MPRYYCFIDIEGTGDNMTTSKVLAIGATCIKVPEVLPTTFTEPEYLDDFMISFKTDEKDFEERCNEEFWNRNDELKALKKRLLEQAVDRKEGLKAFIEWLDKLRKKYQPLTLVSDNKVYDLGRINFELATYLSYHPCIYMKTAKGKYIMCSDIDFADWLNGMAYGLGLIDHVKPRFVKSDMRKVLYDTYGDKQINFKYAHTHNPLDDSKQLSELFWFTIIHLSKVVKPQKQISL
jgi:hypothetical protein